MPEIFWYIFSRCCHSHVIPFSRVLKYKLTLPWTLPPPWTCCVAVCPPTFLKCSFSVYKVCLLFSSVTASWVLMWAGLFISWPMECFRMGTWALGDHEWGNAPQCSRFHQVMHPREKVLPNSPPPRFQHRGHQRRTWLMSTWPNSQYGINQ